MRHENSAAEVGFGKDVRKGGGVVEMETTGWSRLAVIIWADEVGMQRGGPRFQGSMHGKGGNETGWDWTWRKDFSLISVYM